MQRFYFYISTLVIYSLFCINDAPSFARLYKLRNATMGHSGASSVMAKTNKSSRQTHSLSKIRTTPVHTAKNRRWPTGFQLMTLGAGVMVPGIMTNAAGGLVAVLGGATLAIGAIKSMKSFIRNNPPRSNSSLHINSLHTNSLHINSLPPKTHVEYQRTK